MDLCNESCLFGRPPFRPAWQTLYRNFRTRSILTVRVCPICDLQTSAAHMWIKLRLKKIVGAAYIQVRSIDRKLRYT